MYEIEKVGFNGLVKALPRRLWVDLRRLIRNFKYEVSETGIEILRANFTLRGIHEIYQNGLLVETVKNLITIEGLNHLLDVGVHGSTQVTTWYVGAFQNNVTIAPTLTAATFNSTCDEVTTEISESTRPEYTETAASSGGCSNTANPAVITATGAVNIWGAGILSTSTKGDTSAAPTQILLSAAKYTAAKVLSASGDQIGIKYSLSGTSS